MAKYDAFMPVDIRPQVGMNVNVPLSTSGATPRSREASARGAAAAGRVSEPDSIRSATRCRPAYDRLAQQRQAIAIYSEKILPSAERSLQSAQVNYTAGKVDFLRLIDAERQLHVQREKYYEALADYQRRPAVVGAGRGPTRGARSR